MTHPYWPLFDLSVRTPSLELRYVDDDLGVQLADVAINGVHDPSWTPFQTAWTDVDSTEIAPNSFRHWWQCRAETTIDRWNINLAVIERGQVVGATGLSATKFPQTRWFETGSWLGREHQGRGLGTELRVATLHLGFVGFGALWAGTGAFSDNPASLGVTAKLGYEPNGIEVVERRGESAPIDKFRMTREHFEANIKRTNIELVGVEPVCEFLGL